MGGQKVVFRTISPPSNNVRQIGRTPPSTATPDSGEGVCYRQSCRYVKPRPDPGRGPPLFSARREEVWRHLLFDSQDHPCPSTKAEQHRDLSSLSTGGPAMRRYPWVGAGGGAAVTMMRERMSACLFRHSPKLVWQTTRSISSMRDKGMRRT